MRRRLLAALAIVFAAGVVAAPPAFAIKEFFRELSAKYVKPNSKKQVDVALAIAFEQAQCTICHPGDDKHKLSQYGGQVAWRVNKFDKDKKQRIQAAFEEVGKLKSDPRDPKSPTYDQLFKQGRLPPQPQH